MTQLSTVECGSNIETQENVLDDNVNVAARVTQEGVVRHFCQDFAQLQFREQLGVGPNHRQDREGTAKYIAAGFIRCARVPRETVAIEVRCTYDYHRLDTLKI
jgi:hypothetical protein